MFGTLKLTKNADLDKYSYSGYGIGFDFCSRFSVPNFDLSKNDVIFGADNNSLVHIDNKKKDILVLGKGPTQVLNETTITAEAEYSINFSKSQRKLIQSLL